MFKDCSKWQRREGALCTCPHSFLPGSDIDCYSLFSSVSHSLPFLLLFSLLSLLLSSSLPCPSPPLLSSCLLFLLPLSQVIIISRKHTWCLYTFKMKALNIISIAALIASAKVRWLGLSSRVLWIQTYLKGDLGSWRAMLIIITLPPFKFLLVCSSPRFLSRSSPSYMLLSV